MRTSIRFNYVVVYMILMICMLLLMNHYGHFLMLNSLIHETETSLYESANLIAQECVEDIHPFDSSFSDSLPQFRRQFKSLQAISNTRYWLISNDGTILVDSSSSENQEGKNINDYDSTFLDNHTYIGHSLKKLFPQKMLSVIYPLTSNQKTNGYIVLSSSVDTLEKKATDYIDNVIICFFFFFLLLLFAFLYLDLQTVKPLKIVNKALREYADGNYQYRMESIPGQEYKELADSIQYIAEKTGNMNDYQKKFIANVSHDFRSPLTSIRGYTEAMLDGTIPPEMQKKYLNIILFETKRLTKLTSNLLELNQFENNSIILETSTFDINNAVKMTVSTFEQRCIEKKISIELVFSQKTLLVDADINKIEQVVQNLIDNAIKFSHHDSIIEIHTFVRSGKAFVSIKDHGIGIPKESLSKVWNRFYKSDLSRGKDKTGTGLGLSITKEIIKAHGENINVISTEGAGTEFIFTLKAHPADSSRR